MRENIQVIIKRVGDKYKIVPKPLKIKVGEILGGKIKLKLQQDK